MDQGVNVITHRFRRARGSVLTAAAAILLGMAGPFEAAAQLTVRVAVPAATPADSDVYIAGNFNGWNPGNPSYRLTADGEGRWAITLPADVRGPIEFKFTLGSWE